MISLLPDIILRPVAAMTSKCGFSFYKESSPSVNSNTTGISSNDESSEPTHPKASARAVSTVSTVCGDGSDSARSTSDEISDEEVCRRMASLGRSARKAGRHILVGSKLVLS
jgi:outer membrane lipopolysaccharide assembly protein LptE/RlpB